VTATSFVQPSLSEHTEFCYSRCQNPTRLAYETALAELEGGSYCAATASGLAGISLTMDMLPANSHVLVHRGVYGGTHRLFESVKRRTAGLDFTYMDLNDLDAVRKAIVPSTRMI